MSEQKLFPDTPIPSIKGITLMRHDYLPPQTVIASPDVYELIKKAISEQRAKE